MTSKLQRVVAKTAQRGVSLIELLVAVALGLSVILIVLSVFQNFSGSSRASVVEQSMTENAESAFQLIAQQMRQVGYNPRRPRAAVPTTNPLSIGTPPGGSAGMSLFACANGFSNGFGSGIADNIQSLTCNTSTTNTISYAIAVQYEADQYSPSVVGAAPADCRGFAVTAQSVATTTPTGTVSYFVVENRYMINNGALVCTGNGGTTATFATPNQPLVPNIESMQLSFGVTVPGVTLTTANFVAGYLGAPEIGPASGNDTSGVKDTLTSFVPALTSIQRWDLVKTVRVCMIIKAERRSLFEQEGTTAGVYGTYYGCTPDNPINITDGHLRKAYVRHFALRNRISTP